MRVAVLGGGRSSEHDVSLVSAATVAPGPARRRPRGAGRRAGARRHVVARRRGAGAAPGPRAARRRRRLPGPARAVRRGRHGPGAAGAVRRALRRLRRDGQRRLHGQGGVQGADGAGRASRRSATRWSRPARSGPSLEHLGFPLWVKPARLGSSVGIVRVERAEDIDAALDEAFSHDDRVIVEASATGAGDRVLRAGRHARRARQRARARSSCCATAGTTTRPSTPRAACACSSRRGSPTTARERLRETAARAFAAPGCSGLARADFFVDGETVLLNELNTLPGQTPTSVYGVLWEKSGLPYPELVDELCRIAVARFERERALRH